eukprot:jgi/Psemu1/58925/gm1.58925_g
MATQASTRTPRQTLAKREAPDRGRAMPRDSPHCPAALHRPMTMRMACIESKLNKPHSVHHTLAHSYGTLRNNNYTTPPAPANRRHPTIYYMALHIRQQALPPQQTSTTPHGPLYPPHINTHEHNSSHAIQSHRLQQSAAHHILTLQHSTWPWHPQADRHRRQFDVNSIPPPNGSAAKTYHRPAKP